MYKDSGGTGNHWSLYEKKVFEVNSVNEDLKSIISDLASADVAFR